MNVCGECQMFTPKLFLCPTMGMVVTADTYASMCKMGVPRCGDCKMFMPNLLNCTKAKMMGNPVGMQVKADTSACDAFMPR